jgi:hypothetical protein
MQLFTSWTKPNEIIASDMPWAVAWYSDRKSLWLPAKLETLTEFYNLHTLGAPIAGIYLTPVSRDLEYASHWNCGFRIADWRSASNLTPTCSSCIELKVLIIQKFQIRENI